MASNTFASHGRFPNREGESSQLDRQIRVGERVQLAFRQPSDDSDDILTRSVEVVCMGLEFPELRLCCPDR
jgi:hypothetical protein